MKSQLMDRVHDLRREVEIMEPELPLFRRDTELRWIPPALRRSLGCLGRSGSRTRGPGRSGRAGRAGLRLTGWNAPAPTVIPFALLLLPLPGRSGLSLARRGRLPLPGRTRLSLTGMGWRGLPDRC